MGTKRVLCLISEFGYWGEELIGPVRRRRAGKYDALLMVGGSGPTIDMVNNQRVHDLVRTRDAGDRRPVSGGPGHHQ